jgi:hypothetical protein
LSYNLSPFCFIYFQIGSSFCLGPASDFCPPSSISHMVGTTGMYCHTWLVFEIGSCLITFSWAGLDPGSLPTS